MSVTAIVVAAGRGTRAGGDLPKQYHLLAGEPVLTRTLSALAVHPDIERVQTVIGEGDDSLFARSVERFDPGLRTKIAPPVTGGPTRQQSVRAGLDAMGTPPDGSVILVHDGARPLLKPDLIDRAVAAARAHRAAVPGLPLSDTIKRVDGEGRVVETPRREELRAVQTPQAFDARLLVEAHDAASRQGLEHFTDDAGLVEWFGAPVVVFEGDPANVKLTYPADFEAAETRMQSASPPLLSRTASGFDVHAFADGDHVWLGGVRIPHDRGVLAHSDGDVVLHALTDALLGAVADGDIGTHFPPSDPRWRGASSDRFLAHAIGLVRARGGVVDHLDATVLCEAPRVGPHRDAMRRRIAEIAGVPVTSVSVKATTTERLGFPGRGEGLAALASATIRLPQASS